MSSSDGNAQRPVPFVATGAIFALAAALLFAITNIGARASDLHPLWKGAGAYLVAGALLATTLASSKIPWSDMPRVFTMSILGATLAPALFFYGLLEATAVDAGLMLTLEMAFTAVLARIFLAERLGLRHGFGLVCLFGAAVLVAFAAGSGVGESSLRGLFLLGLSAFVWAIDNAVSTPLATRHLPHHVIALKGLIGGTATFVVALAIGAPFPQGAKDWGLILYMGVLGIGLSIVLFYHALRRIGATRTVAVNGAGIAVLGATLGHFILDEALGWFHLAALAFAVLGVGLIATREGPSRPVAAIGP